jgi:NADH dehydrogenase
LGLAAIAGAMAQILPKPLLTRDQVLLMKRDNVVSQGALTLADLGIEATAAEAILPGYLRVYRRPRHRA